MTHFLKTEDNPEGLKLEDVLRKIRADVVHRQIKVIDDTHPVAQKIIANNVKILGHLTEGIILAESSTLLLNKTFGPASEKPRIGTD